MTVTCFIGICEKKLNEKPDHARFNIYGSVRYFDRFHVEEYRFMFVSFRRRQQRMQQDATSRVDQEGVWESAEMKVDDWAEQRVDRYVHASDPSKIAGGNDRQTGRCHHPYSMRIWTGKTVTSTNVGKSHWAKYSYIYSSMEKSWLSSQTFGFSK